MAHSNRDIVNILKEMEQKDLLLKQNEIELWEKTSKIKELEQALDKVQSNTKKMKQEYEAMEKRKNETIANLENHFYDGRNNKEIELLKEENQKLMDEIKDLQAKNDHLNTLMEDKNAVIDKNQIISKYYE